MNTYRQRLRSSRVNKSSNLSKVNKVLKFKMNCFIIKCLLNIQN